MQSEDQALIQKAAGGDRGAFDALHKKYRGRIVNYLARYLRSYQLAEDLTQETFVKVYNNLNNYEPTGKVSSWIYRIATNLAKNRIRGLSREKKISLDSGLKGDDKTNVGDMIETISPSYEERRKLERLEADVGELIGLLPEKYRAVVLLCYLQGMSYEEAAEILHISVINVGVRLTRAKSVLRKKIETMRETERSDGSS